MTGDPVLRLVYMGIFEGGGEGRLLDARNEAEPETWK